MLSRLALHFRSIALRALPAQWDRSEGSTISTMIGACALMVARLALYVAAVVLALGFVAFLLSGCGRSSVRSSEPPTASEECREPTPVYHRATLSVDSCPMTWADVEAEYRHKLETLGGCPFYLYRDEWCPAIDVPEAAPESVAWFGHAFSMAGTCRDLYWPRGAYCHALEEGRFP